VYHDELVTFVRNLRDVFNINMFVFLFDAQNSIGSHKNVYSVADLTVTHFNRSSLVQILLLYCCYLFSLLFIMLFTRLGVIFSSRCELLQCLSAMN